MRWTSENFWTENIDVSSRTEVKHNDLMYIELHDVFLNLEYLKQ